MKILSLILQAFIACGLILANATIPGSAGHQASQHISYSYGERPLQGTNDGLTSRDHCSTRKMLIGSTAPTCTYECRGCKYRCTAEQVPVDSNDPIHSAYHYKCVCHR
ncbi:hypothetical protein Droror1_Dr00018418 [Drosera rotundifolia]